MQTLQEALRDPKIRAALDGLVGCPVRCPVRGVSETEAARLWVWDSLPEYRRRDYTLNSLIEAALYEVNGRYEWKGV